LQGKTVWITGAARRIGREIALACAKQGARIVVHYNTSHEEAEETAQEIHALGGEAYLVKADLSSVDEIESAVSEVLAHWPHIDTLIHNAAVFFPTPFGETNESDWDTTLNSNLKGPYFLTQALLPVLQQATAPSVIFIGDESTAHPAARLIPYAISKEGLRTFSEGLKHAYPKLNTHFIAIGPTLPPEDATLKSPPITHSVDDVVQKVVLVLA
jgi:NAD(P)-dependent dehydrogenase (short-subunit alcohol dehydrogenase family)